VNASVEFHDSQLTAVMQTAEGLFVRLEPAYVHHSTGRPGFDPGSGWLQPVELIFANGIVTGQFPELPCTLADGQISGDVKYDGMIPLPVEIRCAIQLELRSIEGHQIVIRGNSLRMRAVGDANYVEEFTGI
jgi:hypothetical protein